VFLAKLKATRLDKRAIALLGKICQAIKDCQAIKIHFSNVCQEHISCL